MRLWEFDRAGGIASAPFDINKDGHRFVSIVLGYLWMNDDKLGFGPTIVSSEGLRFIDISRNGKSHYHRRSHEAGLLTRGRNKWTVRR
jgi:hypothetical protein